MAFRKILVLPFAALLFTGVLAVNPTDETPESDASKENSNADDVAKELLEGERALERLLGPEVKTLDSLLRPMIEEMARSYGVSQKELAAVAKEVMQRIASMDVNTLQTALSQLAGLGGIDWINSEGLQELLGNVGPRIQEGDMY